VKTNQLIVDLKNQRDAFQETVKQQAKAGEVAWERTKTQLQPHWNSFEAQVKPYIDTASKQIEQQKLAFRDVAAAQVKTWRETADKINDAATKFAAGRRADLEAAVSQMRADAQADARLQKLKQAGSESWMTLSAALAESRKAFDRANQATWDALKRATPPKT
jgi:hypothetical protein